MLDTSCSVGKSLKEQLYKVKMHMYKEFTKNKIKPIYNTNEFKKFCKEAGAPSLFDGILSAVTSSRHSEDRVQLNEKRVVAIIYTLGRESLFGDFIHLMKTRVALIMSE